MYNYIDFSEFRADEILVYLRKSRSDDPLLSVEEVLAKHEAILDEWCERNLGCKIPEENKFREVVSGETIEDRPEFQRILRMIESPRYRGCLVVEVQRLGRPDLEEIGRISKLFRFSNTLVITPQKAYDLRDEYDRDSFERELKRGNEFLEYQKKILIRGKLLSLSQGNFVNSVAPYAYKRVWITEGKRKCPTLEIIEDEAAVVKMIFNMYVNDDMGYVNIARTLDDLGIKPPKGEYWAPDSIRGILSNITYTGMVWWNRRKTVRVVEDSEVKKTRPRFSFDDCLVYEGKHEAIISDELFQAAQDKKGRNHRAKATTKVRNPLAGLLYCRCGRAMSYRTNTKDGVQRNSPRILCDDQVHCGTGSCLYDEMIELVCDILEKSIADFELKMNEEANNSREIHENVIKSLKRRLEDINARELAQWEAQANPDPAQRMPAAIFAQLNAKLMKEKEETEAALHKALESAPTPIDYKSKKAKFSEALAALRDPDMDAARKNKLLKECIERIEYYRPKPERTRRKPGEAKGTTIKTAGGHWTAFPIELDVKLRV